MTWQLEYDPAAKKELAKLDKRIQKDIKSYLDEVCQLDDPADRGHSLSGPWAGFHRYMRGQIRLIVAIQRTQITLLVVKIGRRDSVY